MTEAEYIRTIRDVANRYLEVIREPGDFMNGEGIRRIRHWHAITEKLSAHTAIKLCDLWLKKNGGEPAAGTSPQIDPGAAGSAPQRQEEGKTTPM
jgi:hypothetical protein